MQLKMSSALTPTLSPGEREPPLGALDPITVQRLSYDGRNVLPLPGGEGWGEGGISLRLHGYGFAVVALGVPPDVEPWLPAWRKQVWARGKRWNFSGVATRRRVLSGRRDARPLRQAGRPTPLSL